MMMIKLEHSNEKRGGRMRELRGRSGMYTWRFILRETSHSIQVDLHRKCISYDGGWTRYANRLTYKIVTKTIFSGLIIVVSTMVVGAFKVWSVSCLVHP